MATTTKTTDYLPGIAHGLGVGCQSFTLPSSANCDCYEGSNGITLRQTFTTLQIAEKANCCRPALVLTMTRGCAPLFAVLAVRTQVCYAGNAMVERKRLSVRDAELSRPALVLAQRYVQRRDLHADQLDDGSYVCLHEQLKAGRV